MVILCKGVFVLLMHIQYSGLPCFKPLIFVALALIQRPKAEPIAAVVSPPASRADSGVGLDLESSEKRTTDITAGRSQSLSATALKMGSSVDISGVCMRND